jgi:predicted transcriptional regulator
MNDRMADGVDRFNSQERTMSETVHHAAAIVAAYAVTNRIAATDLPGLVGLVRRTLDSLVSGPTMPIVNRLAPVPAVKPTASVFEDHIVCLGCGKHVQLLRRHIMIAHRMSPAEYRRHWGLPAAYPMVASNYTKVRH